MSLARVGDARSTGEVGVLAPSLRKGLEDLYRHEQTTAPSVRRGRLACAGDAKRQSVVLIVTRKLRTFRPSRAHNSYPPRHWRHK